MNLMQDEAIPTLVNITKETFITRGTHMQHNKQHMEWNSAN